MFTRVPALFCTFPICPSFAQTTAGLLLEITKLPRVSSRLNDLIFLCLCFFKAQTMMKNISLLWALPIFRALKQVHAQQTAHIATKFGVFRTHIQPLAPVIFLLISLLANEKHRGVCSVVDRDDYKRNGLCQHQPVCRISIRLILLTLTLAKYNSWLYTSPADTTTAGT